MTQIKFIRDDDGRITEKVFNDTTFSSSPFQSLSAGEIIDVECEDKSVKEYIVMNKDWEFTHFGNTLTITIKPVVKA